jgi:hypothetical protein
VGVVAVSGGDTEAHPAHRVMAVRRSREESEERARIGWR